LRVAVKVKKHMQFKLFLNSLCKSFNVADLRIDLPIVLRILSIQILA
jgi:hypothetical protein